MNIHEHQAKKLLQKYGAKVPNGVFALDPDELLEKVKSLNTEKYVLKAPSKKQQNNIRFKDEHRCIQAAIIKCY